MKLLLYILIIIGLWAAATTQAQDLILTGDIASEQYYTYGSITTQGTTVIGAGVNLDLVGQSSVTLSPGLKVLPGGSLRATASQDSDGDLIHNILEGRQGCMNPQLQDTDGDGLLDNEEDINRNGLHEPDLNETNPCSVDTDGDNIGDKWELDNGFDPLTKDEAQNLILTGTLPSGVHYINGIIATKDSTTLNAGVTLDLVAQTHVRLNPGLRVLPGATLKATASPDTDGDRIHNYIERRSGCQNPNAQDTDGDGLSDSQEDANRNGLHELALSETSACNSDTDGDKIDDKWELDNSLDPLADDAGEDPDGDNLTNYLEYYFNSSDPQDGSSLPPKGTYYEYDDLGRVKKIVRIK